MRTIEKSRYCQVQTGCTRNLGAAVDGLSVNGLIVSKDLFYVRFVLQKVVLEFVATGKRPFFILCFDRGYLLYSVSVPWII